MSTLTLSSPVSPTSVTTLPAASRLSWLLPVFGLVAVAGCGVRDVAAPVQAIDDAPALADGRDDDTGPDPGERLNDAAFVSQAVPSEVKAGETFTVVVTMMNVGDKVWTGERGHCLGSEGPQDNFRWGTNRGFLAAGETVPGGAEASITVALTAPDVPGSYGMQWQMLQNGVEWFGEMSPVVSVVVTERPAPQVDTSPTGLRAFRGDFGGIYLPEIAPQCPEDPQTHIRCVGDNGGNPRGLVAGELFTPAYPLYTESQRAAIRSAYKARGYTHFPYSIFCDQGRWYHGLYPAPDCTKTNDRLKELVSDGIIPVCFVLRDGETSPDIGGVDKSLCPIVVPMWEMNGPLDNDTAAINRAIMATRAAFPSTMMYVHFTAEHAAGGSPEADWWKWATQDAAGPHVQGILYQDDRWNDAGAMKDRVVDFLIRLGGGYHGWPNPVDVVLFETDIYPKFWDGRTEAQGVAFNDQVLEFWRNPTCISEGGVNYCGQLAGFCSGGTIAGVTLPPGPTPPSGPGPDPGPGPGPTSNGSQGATLVANQSLSQGHSVTSGDGRFSLVYQNDGNLVLYQNGVGPLWASNTVGTSTGSAVMQGDGNFVIYDAGGLAVWHTHTYDHPGAALTMQNDGNAVIYDAGGVALWSTGTAGH